MSERTTPETNALYAQLLAENPGYFIHLEEFLELARRLEQERDEARAELAEWTDSAKNVRKQYDDEQHCSCVPILRKLLKDAERERDEARLDKRGG
jgi:DNA-binding protein H-NS